MYCPGCGAETTQGLNYCKQCGASLTGSDVTRAPGKPPTWLVLSFLVVFGLIGVIGLLAPIEGGVDMLRNGFSPREILVICLGVAGGAVLMILFLSRLFFQLVSIYAGVQPEFALKKQRPTAPVLPRQIGSSHAGVPSVTEQTTRSFDLADLADRQESRSR